MHHANATTSDHPPRLRDDQTGQPCAIATPVAVTVDSPATRRPNRVIYVLAASHSGSTLLSMLLAAHPEICTVGELKATIHDDINHYLCSCGVNIRRCPFWQDVATGMVRRGLEFDISNARTDIRGVSSSYARRLLRPLHHGPLMERARYRLVALLTLAHRTPHHPETERRAD